MTNFTTLPVAQVGTGSAGHNLFAEVRRVIEPHIEDLIRDWLPDGKKQGREWVSRNPTRDDRHAGSFRANLNTGLWCDHATGDGGDSIGLYAYLHGLSPLEAAKTLASQFGINQNDYRQHRPAATYLPKAEVERLTHIVQLGAATPAENLTPEDSEFFEASRDQLHAYMGDEFAEPVELKDCPVIVIPEGHTATEKQIAWLKAQLKEVDEYPKVAALALELGKLYSRRVPYQYALEDVLKRIKDAVPPIMLHSCTLSQIESRLRFLINQRQDRALEHPTPEQYSRHKVKEVTELAPIPETELERGGVFIIRAPHGKGKTQRVAYPFAQWASRQTDGRFVAIAHRQSLVGELAERLHCDDYRTLNHLTASQVWKLATCLQSIVADDKAQIFRECRYLFIDEVAQVLEAITANVGIAGKKTKADLLAALKQLIQQAKVLVVTDAGIDEKTIAFLEDCRPNEQFNILTMEPDPVGHVDFIYGDALGDAAGELQARLDEGEILWVSCGERNRAALLASYAKQVTDHVLLITRETTGEPAVQAFLNDPEGQSRRWSCIIHTGCISSGLSIEHRTGQHFTHGMLISSGSTITPADAVQMMRRVRYLKSWSVFTLPNHVRVTDAKGAAQGAYETTGRQFSEYDHFAAKIEQSRTTRQADFTAGLWWLLEDFRFEVSSVAATDEGLSEVRSRQKSLKDQRITAILEAQDLSPQQAENLQGKPAPTEAEHLALLKYRCKVDLGADALTHSDVEDWQEGAAVRRWDRFSAAFLGVYEADQFGTDLTLGRYGKQIASEYQQLFDGISIHAGARISEKQADLILDRIMARRLKLAFLRIVPAKYGRLIEKNGVIKQMQRPSAAYKEVGDLLRLMGLNTKRVKVKAASKSGTDTMVFDKTFTKTGGSVPTEKPHEYRVEDWSLVESYATRRNAALALEPLIKQSQPQQTVQPDYQKILAAPPATLEVYHMHMVSRTQRVSSLCNLERADGLG